MQIFTQKDILKSEERSELKHLMIKEIAEALDTSVARYQSQGPQQHKHPTCISLQTLCKKIETVASELMNKPMAINNCWFVICKEDSDFEFHHHSPEIMSVVYYLENCNNNGTIFETQYTKLQVLSEDNTAIFFESDIMHCTPKWPGQDRYSIAFDLEFKK
jgi:hypothetical protein